MAQEDQGEQELIPPDVDPEEGLRDYLDELQRRVTEKDLLLDSQPEWEYTVGNPEIYDNCLYLDDWHQINQEDLLIDGERIPVHWVQFNPQFAHLRIRSDYEVWIQRNLSLETNDRFLYCTYNPHPDVNSRAIPAPPLEPILGVDDEPFPPIPIDWGYIYLMDRVTVDSLRSYVNFLIIINGYIEEFSDSLTYLLEFVDTRIAPQNRSHWLPEIIGLRQRVNAMREYFQEIHPINADQITEVLDITAVVDLLVYQWTGFGVFKEYLYY